MEEPADDKTPGADDDPGKKPVRPPRKQYAIRKATYGKSGQELIEEAKEARRRRRGPALEP